MTMVSPVAVLGDSGQPRCFLPKFMMSTLGQSRLSLHRVQRHLTINLNFYQMTLPFSVSFMLRVLLLPLRLRLLMLMLMLTLTLVLVLVLMSCTGRA